MKFALNLHGIIAIHGLHLVKSISDRLIMLFYTILLEEHLFSLVHIFIFKKILIRYLHLHQNVQSETLPKIISNLYIYTHIYEYDILFACEKICM